MSALLRILVLSTLVIAAVSQTIDFDGSIEMIPNSFVVEKCAPRAGVSNANCADAAIVCDNVYKCLATAKAVKSGGFFFLESNVGSANCKGFVMSVQQPKETTPPQTPDLSPELDRTTVPGSYVIKSISASVNADQQPLTTYIKEEFFTGSRVEGTLVAQCDGMTMYLAPGSFRQCTATFKVTEGSVMGVDSQQEQYRPESNTKLGTIYALRVKQNPSPADFKVCNETFMGSYSQTIEGGEGTFPVSCFRRFTVEEQQTSIYNISYCGTQLGFYNMGMQNETSCRDGVGVVTEVSNVPQITGTRAGVFYHRTRSLQVDPAPTNVSFYDPEWFFTLTPSRFPLNESSQLDMELTRLNGLGGANATQIRCIADRKSVV